MATVKKMMKKSAPKKAVMKKAPAKAMPAMGEGPMMKKGGKVKKAAMGTTTSETTKKPMSGLDSMNMFANRYDSLSAEAAKKMQAGKNASKDIKGANAARSKEKAIAKRLYGTTPSNKKGGVTKKKMMKMGGKMSKGKKC